MVVTTTRVIEGPAAERCWRLYTDAFAELRTAAVQRHVMTRAEFDSVLVDKRVTKYIAVDPVRRYQLCALGTMTNELEAMPLISPDYFAHRWPRRYAERRIWYIGFVAIDPRYHGTGILPQIVESVCEVVGADGIAVLDICRHNEEVYRLPGAIRRLIDTFVTGVRATRLDEQTYWAYEMRPPS